MARRIPGEAPVWSLPPQNDLTVLTLTLKTITPMFGGSAKPREVDTKHPIRAASIRGHLRFWWRATAGATYTSADELFKAEAELWGSTETPGLVAVRVDVLTSGISKPFAEIAPKATSNGGPQEGFFLFPFDEIKAENKPSVPGIIGVRFQVKLSCPAKFRSDVVRAVKSWITFGGVGARTRRGLGALTVEGDNDAKLWLPPVDCDNWLRELIGTEVPLGETQQTRLAGGLLLFGDITSPIGCWKKLGIFWAEFRKGLYISREKSKWGSEWSDHETLRTLPRDTQEVELSKPYFGLPIVYQKFDRTRKDPESFAGTLDAKTVTGRRMASPVILKPIAFADGSFRPMIVLLKTPLPTKISIGERELLLREPKSDPVLAELKAKRPLEAVALAAKRRGFKEVSL